jgi:hypothetical protein
MPETSGTAAPRHRKVQSLARQGFYVSPRRRHDAIPFLQEKPRVIGTATGVVSDFSTELNEMSLATATDRCS